MPIDNIPTATRNILDHFEVCLSKIPWTILAAPINKSPSVHNYIYNLYKEDCS